MSRWLAAFAAEGGDAAAEGSSSVLSSAKGLKESLQQRASGAHDSASDSGAQAHEAATKGPAPEGAEGEGEVEEVNDGGAPRVRKTAAGLRACDSLRKEEETAGVLFDTGYSRFESAWRKADEMLRRREQLWQENSSQLEGLCMKLKDAVDKVNESKEICEEAQSDDWQGLPGLFRKKAADGERFAKLGAVGGCVDKEGHEKECVCETGDEATGCTSSGEEHAGHQLACTRIFKNRMNELNIADVFKAGGACHIGKAAEINNPVTSVGQFTLPADGLRIGLQDEVSKLKEAALGPAAPWLALAAASPAARGQAAAGPRPAPGCRQDGMRRQPRAASAALAAEFLLLA